jgi:hypothetical protein
MASAAQSAGAALLARARAAFSFLLGPRDTWLPAAALLLPALAWLALEGRAYPRFEPYQTGDIAKIELYTRLAAEGSQRVGTESRFHIHQPGPSFFYAIAPVYLLAGEDMRAMALAALVWHAFFLLALLRGASALAPGTGPLAAALLLVVALQARGPGLLLSPWNPHAGLLPFGAMLLASARLATGDGRALPLAVLAASVVLQCQVAWAPGVLLTCGAGLALFLWPAARRALGIPTLGPGLSWRGAGAAALVACVLWALPVADELTGEYRNFHRMLALRRDPRSPTPWLETLAPAARALNLRRDGEPPETAYAWGVHNLGYDPRLAHVSTALGRRTPALEEDAALAVAVSLALAASGWLAARRRSPTAALAVVAAVGIAATAVAVRYLPGRAFPPYLFMWGGMVTFAALLVAVTELFARAPRFVPRRGVAAALLLGLAVALVADGWRTQPFLASPRDPRSILIERVTEEVRERAATDLPPGRRFLLRIAPYEDQFTAIGLILALDKAGLRFGVEPFGSCRVEGRFTPRGDEWAELLVGNLPAAPGARRLGPPGGSGFVWQVAWRDRRDASR